MKNDLKKRVKEWADKIGLHSAWGFLIQAGLSGTTAGKLVKGTYESEPKKLVIQACESAMKKWQK